MGIGFVELKGSIPRQQDFQAVKHQEDTKMLVEQNHLSVQGERKLEQAQSQVNKQENASPGKEKKEHNSDAYQGDGGRRRPGNKKEEKREQVLEKNARPHFDFRV